MRLGYDQWVAQGRAVHPDPMEWRFVCPSCGDIASGHDFPFEYGSRAGQECIGRYVADRGCGWVAYGLIPGPVALEISGRSEAYVFCRKSGEWSSPEAADRVLEALRAIAGPTDLAQTTMRALTGPTGLGRQQISCAIRRLMDTGALERVRLGLRGSQRSAYRLLTAPALEMTA